MIVIWQTQDTDNDVLPLFPSSFLFLSFPLSLSSLPLYLSLSLSSSSHFPPFHIYFNLFLLLCLSCPKKNSLSCAPLSRSLPLTHTHRENHTDTHTHTHKHTHRHTDTQTH